MAPDTTALIRDGLALDVDQRAVVVNALLNSLHDTDHAGEVDAAWRAEIHRRIEDIESDKVELLDVDESHAALRAELAARRK